jgi:hypothetical protein
VCVNDPDLDSAERCFIAFAFETQQQTEVDHATHAQAYNDATAATLRFHHWHDELFSSLFQVGIARHGLDLVRDIVMLEEASQDATGAEGVGFEGDEDEDGWRQGMAGLLEVGVEFRDEGAREIHVENSSTRAVKTSRVAAEAWKSERRRRRDTIEAVREVVNAPVTRGREVKIDAEM